VLACRITAAPEKKIFLLFLWTVVDTFTKTLFKTLFGCGRIHINPHVLWWIEMEFELNSTPIHTNTHKLKWIQQHPNKAEWIFL